MDGCKQVVVPLLHWLPVMQRPDTGIGIELGIPGKSPTEGIQLCSAETVNSKRTKGLYYKHSVTETRAFSCHFCCFYC